MAKKETKKNALIIGGGFAGIRLYHLIKDKFNVLLFDYKDYFEFTPDITSAIADPKVYKDINFQYKEVLGVDFFKGGLVQLIDSKTAIVSIDPKMSLAKDQWSKFESLWELENMNETEKNNEIQENSQNLLQNIIIDENSILVQGEFKGNQYNPIFKILILIKMIG